MYRDFSITPPFFEIGPKCYLYGDELLLLANAADRASRRYDVPIIFDPPCSAIAKIAESNRSLLIFSQHLDPLEPGRGMGAFLPEAIRAAGAVGTILNHAERPLDLSTLARTIVRARGTGLATMVCADSIEEATAIAHLQPDIIAAEPTVLIGSSESSSSDYVSESIRRIKEVDSRILVLQGAGIRSGTDVYETIKAGADGTGSSSAIATAADPEAMINEMVEAVRTAWNERIASRRS